jgi:ParB/RepB/Spo0J family partition protein
MPKLETQGGIKKLSLSQIIESGNIRETYTDIPELAESIKAHGQLQPVLVKTHGKNNDGLDQYELVAGHRRIRAFRHLCDQGDDFSRIDAMVVSGDKLTLQLIENLQRSDLSAAERERGIYEMTKDGKITHHDVAAILGKNEQYVWRHISAHKTRDLCAKNGVDTSGINTGTLCEIASAADGDIPLLIERIKDEGGTLAAARRVGREYRGATNQKLDEAVGKSFMGSHEEETAPESDDDFDIGEPEDERSASFPSSKSKTPPAVPISKRASRGVIRTEEFDLPHKMVDINDVLVIIKDYIDHTEEHFAGSEVFYKKEAAYDIIALLHERL